MNPLWQPSTILEVTEGSPRKTFSYEAERKRARNHSVNFHGAVGGQTIRFLWTMNLRALSLKERFRSWLTVYPENTKEAWARRPQHDANDSAVAKCLFSARTRERILRRQLLHTGNALTKVLPHEIVLRIVEQMEGGKAVPTAQSHLTAPLSQRDYKAQELMVIE
jgi:hypothetical protein